MDQESVLKTIRQFKKALESINIIVDKLILLIDSNAVNTSREYSIRIYRKHQRSKQKVAL